MNVQDLKNVTNKDRIFEKRMTYYSFKLLGENQTLFQNVAAY